MIVLVFRLALFLGVIAALFFMIQWFLKPTDFIRCGRCEGRGFWYAARGKEVCDWCKGSGKLPNLTKKK